MIGIRRVTIYIDGFNLYYALMKPNYALLKPNPAVRWLDLAALGATLRSPRCAPLPPTAATCVRSISWKPDT